MDFLKSLGITDFKYKSQPSVKIPCYAEDSTERVVHFKLALTVAEGARRWLQREGFGHTAPDKEGFSRPGGLGGALTTVRLRHIMMTKGNNG
jgi:hypothetical protein